MNRQDTVPRDGLSNGFCLSAGSKYEDSFTLTAKSHSDDKLVLMNAAKSLVDLHREFQGFRNEASLKRRPSMTACNERVRITDSICHEGAEKTLSLLSMNEKVSTFADLIMDDDKANADDLCIRLRNIENYIDNLKQNVDSGLEKSIGKRMEHFSQSSQELKEINTVLVRWIISMRNRLNHTYRHCAVLERSRTQDKSCGKSHSHIDAQPHCSPKVHSWKTLEMQKSHPIPEKLCSVMRSFEDSLDLVSNAVQRISDHQTHHPLKDSTDSKRNQTTAHELKASIQAIENFYEQRFREEHAKCLTKVSHRKDLGDSRYNKVREKYTSIIFDLKKKLKAYKKQVLCQNFEALEKDKDLYQTKCLLARTENLLHSSREDFVAFQLQQNEVRAMEKHKQQTAIRSNTIKVDNMNSELERLKIALAASEAAAMKDEKLKSISRILLCKLRKQHELSWEEKIKEIRVAHDAQAQSMYHYCNRLRMQMEDIVSASFKQILNRHEDACLQTDTFRFSTVGMQTADMRGNLDTGQSIDRLKRQMNVLQRLLSAKLDLESSSYCTCNSLLTGKEHGVTLDLAQSNHDLDTDSDTWQMCGFSPRYLSAHQKTSIYKSTESSEAGSTSSLQELSADDSPSMEAVIHMAKRVETLWLQPQIRTAVQHNLCHDDLDASLHIISDQPRLSRSRNLKKTSTRPRSQHYKTNIRPICR